MLSFAVIGHPIGHTMSPFIHKSLFKLSGVEVEYLTLDIDPNELKGRYLDTLRNLDGFNITIPHKQAIIPLLDRLDESALGYGAVNCVKKGVGYNTDAYGFLQSLSSEGIALQGKVLLLGNGGAARTFAFEAAKAGCELDIAARGESGNRLADEINKKFSKSVKVIPFDEVKGGYDLVVNATPVGMYPNTEACPLKYEQLEGCSCLFDAIYNPRQTQLITLARERDMTVAEGMAMLVWQAVGAHEIWYGARFDPKDIERLISAANDEMQRLFGD